MDWRALRYPSRSKRCQRQQTTVTPRFQDWAPHYFDDAVRRGLQTDPIEQHLRVALRFWGAPPSKPTDRQAGAPYHNLTLGDVVADPSWILKWEDWLEQPKRLAGKMKGNGPPTFRPWSAQTKNHYRSLMSELFRLAMSPPWRKITGITTNPFAGGWRDPAHGRVVALEVDDVLAILRSAGYHLRKTIAIALLAPKLREGNILQLKWSQHVAPDFSRITVQEHKTRRQMKRPLVAFVPEQLRAIMKDAKTRAGRGDYVITYRGRRVKSIVGAMRGAVERAQLERPHLAYGRDRADGITFHTFRHTAATVLANLEVPPEKRQQLLGHPDLASTMLYTHMRPRHELPVAELLSGILPIAEPVTDPRVRAKSVGTPKTQPAELLENRRESTEAARLEKSS